MVPVRASRRNVSWPLAFREVVRGRLLILLLAGLFVTSSCVARVSVVPQRDELAPASLADAPAPQPTPRAAPPPRLLIATRFPYVAQPEWLPTRTNYDEGRGGAAVNWIVLHYTDISYARTLKAFSIPASNVSAHYVVRGDGHIGQVVGEADTAWHAGNYWFNQRSIGIELELDHITNPFFTAEQYYAAAALACAISARQGVPLDRTHVVGHNEVPGSNHSDPGPTWDWPHFMYLTSLCAPPTAATVHASFVSESAFPSVAANESASISIELRNTGGTAWRKGTDQEARLGVRDNGPDLAFLADGWPTPDRPAVQTEEIVPPGATATFTFAVKSELPGTYVLPLRGVVDGGAWMDDMGLYAKVTVRKGMSGRKGALE